MMMKMLEAGGMDLYTDGVRKSDEHNPGGYYEHQRVMQLEQSSADWFHEACGKAVKMVSHKLRLLPTNYNYKVVMMRRQTRDSVKSQTRMIRHIRDVSANEDEIVEFMKNEFAQAMAVVDDRSDMAVLMVDYEHAMQHPEETARAVKDFIGQDSMDVAAMQGVVDPSMWHNKSEPE